MTYREIGLGDRITNRLMKLAGHKQTYLYEIDGHGHGGMIEPGYHILETHIRQMLGYTE